MTRLAFTLAAALLAAPAMAQTGSIIGLWAHPGGPCDRNAPTELVPVLVENRAISFYESGCTIDGAELTGVGSSLKLDLTCSGEGDTWATGALAMVDIEDRLLLYWPDGGMFVGHRCQ